MTDLEEREKKLDEEIEMLDESFLAGTLTKSQYDLQMEEKDKEKEEIIARQLNSQEAKQMETITEPKMQESSSKRPLTEEESNKPPLEDESELLSKESERMSLHKKDIGMEPSVKTHTRVEIREPPLDMEREKLESEGSNQQSLKQSSKGRRHSSMREIGRSFRRTSMKERRISMKEASEKRIIAEEPSPKADEINEQSLSNEQPTEAEKEHALEEVGNGSSKERGGEEQSAIGGTSKSPDTGQEGEELTISHEPDVERKKKKAQKNQFPLMSLIQKMPTLMMKRENQEKKRRQRERRQLIRRCHQICWTQKLAAITEKKVRGERLKKTRERCSKETTKERKSCNSPRMIY
uniref:Uncharacterized protein n=2 Tax=Lygus hesperus TaxID=30085 RepID=A0A0A9WQT8_LYGHE